MRPLNVWFKNGRALKQADSVGEQLVWLKGTRFLTDEPFEWDNLLKLDTYTLV
jgi:hypothetical protein